MHHTRTAPPRTAPWPLAPFLEDLGAVFRMQLPEAMNLRISIRNRNLSLVQVPERMRMLLATLLDWGVQNAGTTGGQVEWLLEQDERGPLDHPSLRKQARTWAHLQITDNGPCLCDEERERFFEPFALATRYDERCGLGLSLVRHMLSRESGHIQVQSPVQDGRGVRFDVWLEAAPPVTRQLEGGEPNASDDQGNRPLSGDRPHHLLIVDDEPDLSRAIQLMLQRRGFTVSVRADSRSALELIMRDTGAISAVISDMNMPGMNGLELARTLADLPRRPAFILCTGLVPSEWPDPGHVDAVLVKPVSRQDYMDTLERLNIRPASGVKG